MPSSNLQRRLQDILELGAEIEEFTRGLSFAEFQQDTKTVRAVLYDLAVIGEAAGNVLPEAETLYPEVPWVDIRGMRNIVIHEYFRVNFDIIWETIKTDLPPLLEQLQKVLEHLE